MLKKNCISVSQISIETWAILTKYTHKTVVWKLIVFKGPNRVNAQKKLSQQFKKRSLTDNHSPLSHPSSDLVSRKKDTQGQNSG